MKTKFGSILLLLSSTALSLLILCCGAYIANKPKSTPQAKENQQLATATQETAQVTETEKEKATENDGYLYPTSYVENEPSNSSNSNYEPTNSYEPSSNSNNRTRNCSYCHNTHKVECYSCDGKGKHTKTKSAPNYNSASKDTSYEVTTTCSTCRGTGTVKCSKCVS